MLSLFTWYFLIFIEGILIWVKEIPISSFQMNSYILDGLFTYILLNRDRMILLYFPKSYKHSETNKKIILMNPYMVDEYSSFSTIPLGQRCTDYSVYASMASFYPLQVEQSRVLPIFLICNSVLKKIEK